MPSFIHNQKPTIGVLAGWQFYNTATSFNYLIPAYKGIIQASKQFDCNLLLGCGLGGEPDINQPNHPAWPLDSPDCDYDPIGPWNTDGLIVFAPLHSKVRSAYLQELITKGFPVQFIGGGEKGPTLAVDNVGGVKEAINHLVNHGHKKIAFIAGSPDDMEGDSGERLDAFKSALKENNLHVDPKCITFGWHVYDGGSKAIEEFRKSGAEFTALLASNDEMALGAMHALNAAGLKIPKDVAVIGFDNRLEDTTHKPSLSSIHIPIFQMGYKALELMKDQILGNISPPDMMRIKTKLMRRGSCGCEEIDVMEYVGESDWISSAVHG